MITQHEAIRWARAEAERLRERAKSEDVLADSRVHPAAPIVLAGGALEEFLRSMVITHHATVKGKPGVQAYGEALAKASVLNQQDVKNVIAWAVSGAKRLMARSRT